MKAIDPHIHMVSRTTDDYLKMAISGIHTVAEPAFWAGFDRSSADSFRDYFHQLTVTEPARAARFGIRHYCWIGLNSKESENLKLAEDVLAIMALRFVPGELPAGSIEIVLAGGGMLKAEAECIEVRLTDLGPRWQASSRPAHGV